MANNFECVSEDSIAFWACVFPGRKTDPIEVKRCYHLNKPLEIYCYEYDVTRKYHFRSIEIQYDNDDLKRFVDLASPACSEGEREASAKCVADGSKHASKKQNKTQNSRGSQETTKVRGYRMAWYGHFGEVKTEDVLRFFHPALIFSRCFFFPSSPAYVSKHASRVQNLFGMARLNRGMMKNLLYKYDDLEMSFAHLVLKAKSCGSPLLGADVLRAWCARAFDVRSLSSYVSSPVEGGFVNPCLFCAVSPVRPFNAIVKLGSIWAKVQIQIGASDDHVRGDALNVLLDTSCNRVDFSLGHRVKLVGVEGIDVHGLTYARLIRFSHRYLRDLLLGADVDSEDEHHFFRTAFMLGLRTHVWREEDVPAMYWLSALQCGGIRELNIDRNKAVSDFSYFVEKIEDPVGIESEERAIAIRRIRMIDGKVPLEA